MNQLTFLLMGKPHPMPWVKQRSQADALAEGRAHRIAKTRENALKSFSKTEWRNAGQLASVTGRTRANMILHARRFMSEGLVEERWKNTGCSLQKQWRLK